MAVSPPIVTESVKLNLQRCSQLGCSIAGFEHTTIRFVGTRHISLFNKTSSA